MEFNSIMAGHFENVADQEQKKAEEKRKQEEEAMKSDPIYQKIQSDPQVKAHLEDPKV